MTMPGRVFLVGAGPGDSDLLTLRALRLIARAEVIVYDRLVSDDVLALAAPGAKMIPVGKKPKRHPVPQERINEILVREAQGGRMTVRLKGGDPFIFGRGSEEALALQAHGIPCEVVPGITAAQGCAAATGVPLTHRGLASSVHYITGHCKHDQPLAFDWQGLADPDTTLVIYMGVANIAEISTRLIEAGRPATTPVLAINNGTTPKERRLISDLRQIASMTRRTRFEGPVLFIVGEVVSLYDQREICPIVRAVMALEVNGGCGAAPAHEFANA